MTLGETYLYWLKAGMYTVGSGYGILPYLNGAVRGDQLQMTSLQVNISISQVCPGPISTNLAAICGYMDGPGVFSSIAAVAGILTVPMLILLVFNLNYRNMSKTLKTCLEFYLIPLVCSILIYSATTLIDFHVVYSDLILYTIAAVLILVIRVSTIKCLLVVGCLKVITYYSYLRV